MNTPFKDDTKTRKDEHFLRDCIELSHMSSVHLNYGFAITIII